MNQIRKQTHPSSVQLAAFAIKRLSEDDRAKVEKHLAECNTCRTFLAKTPGDDLAKLLKEHQATSLHQQSTPAMHDQSTMSGRRRPQQSQLSSGGSPVKGAANAAETIPPELHKQKKYRVIRLLGRGGMGAVYEADHTMMRRKVAIKVISPSLISDPQALQRFELEVVAAAQLDHPNVARAYDADQFGSMRALIMEFVPGRSLDKLLASVGSLPIETACRCVRQALAGLQHAHEHGMVHRDLKPHNLMLTPDGKLKVLDFGLAKLTEAQAPREGLTSANAIMGTTHYMAPEQALDAKTADIRADIYSLGCTLFYLIAGRPPFEADTEMKILLAHQRDVPPPLNELRDDVPEGLAKLIAWMLEKNPADRPQTPVEIGRALAPYARGEFDTAVPEADTTQKEATELEAIAKLAEVSALPKTRIEKPQPSGARRNYWISAGAGILVSLFFFAWLFGGFKANTPEGSIIIDKVPADVNVEVDGATVTLTRDGETVMITAVEAGDHHLRFLRDGQEVWASDASLPFGEELVRVKYEPPVADSPVAKQDSNQGGQETTNNQLAQDNAKTSEAGYQEDVPLDLTEPAAMPSRDQQQFSYAEIKGGDWSIEGNELIQSNKTESAHLLFGNPEWTSYDLHFKAKVTSGTYGFKVLFAATDFGRHRMIEFGAWHNKKHVLVPLIENRWQNHFVAEGVIARNQWHEVVLKVRGTECSCFLEDQLLFSKVIAPNFSKGRIGFATADGTVVHFKDILITSAETGTPLWSGPPKLLAADTNVADADVRSARQAQVFEEGEWKIIGTELVQSSSEPVLAGIAFGQKDWQDIDFVAEFEMPDTETPNILIAFNGTDRLVCRALQLRPTHQQLLHSKGDPDRAEVVRQSENRLDVGWHKVWVKLRDGQCDIVLNDEPLFSSHSAEYIKGMVGFGTIGTPCRFRNIEVTAPDGRQLWKGLPDLPATTKSSPSEDAGSDVPTSVESEIRFARLYGGDWQIQEDELVQLSDGAEIKSIAFGDLKWRDLDISAEVKIPDTAGPKVYVVFNTNDVMKCRALRLGCQYQELYGLDGKLNEDPVRQVHNGLSPGWHKVEITLRDGRCECFLDGKRLFEPHQDRSYAAGCIGFATYGTSGRFRNIEVTAPNGESLWTGLPVLPKKPGAPAKAAPETRAPAPAQEEVKGPRTFDLDRWHISQPSLVQAEEQGTTIQAGTKGNFFISKTAYGDVNLDLELKAEVGTDAWLIFRGKKDGEKWTGITSRIYDNGEAISAGMQFHSYEFAEHGMRPEHAEYGVPFHLHANLKNEVMWLKVNDVTTSGVSYRRRWEETSGSIGLYVERGSVTISRFDVNGSEAMRVRAKGTDGTVSIAEPQKSEAPEIIQLNEAKADCEKGIAEARKAFIDRLKRSEELARTTQDKEEKRSERLAFENQGIIPSGGISKEYEREIAKQESLLQLQYSEARKSFKRNGQWSEAEEVLREWVGAPQDAASEGGRFYKLFTDVVTWQEAQDRCREQGGHLAIVTSPSQNNLVATHLSVAECSSAWLGASYQREERSWKWVDGVTSRYTNWQAGQPLTSNNKVDQYLMMVVEQDKGLWVSQPNRASKYQPGFVCEWYRHLD